MKLEELLNKLIEKGWKPFGRETRHELSSGVVYDTIDIKGKGDIRVIDRRHHHIRELVSKESGLWQFCVENGMVRITETNSLCNWLFGEEIYYDETQTEKLYKNDNYEYWLIESALKDESELEQFLIDNIKI